MANKYIPPQFAGNLVYLDETVAGIADVLIAPPAGRWVAIHNIHDTALNILAPENEVLRYIAKGGDARSDVHGEVNSGNLKEDTAKTDFTGTVTSEETSATGELSGKTNVAGSTVVTRNGVDITGLITKPTFDGIDYNGTAVTDIIVNAEGAGLETGDVITFPITDGLGVTVTYTIGGDDLQLSAGFYALKTTTRKQIHLLAAGDIMYFNNSKIEIQAADDGDNGIAIGYFG